MAAMSILTDILDRLSGITAMRERVNDLTVQLGELRRVVVEQQKDIAGVQGQLKALIQMQSQSPRLPAGKRSSDG
jgi:uncharacterized coiled-coil protein SlyX